MDNNYTIVKYPSKRPIRLKNNNNKKTTVILYYIFSFEQLPRCINVYVMSYLVMKTESFMSTI